MRARIRHKLEWHKILRRHGSSTTMNDHFKNGFLFLLSHGIQQGFQANAIHVWHTEYNQSKLILMNANEWNRLEAMNNVSEFIITHMHTTHSLTSHISCRVGVVGIPFTTNCVARTLQCHSIWFEYFFLSCLSFLNPISAPGADSISPSQRRTLRFR